ncbi:MAG: hypothetical protein H6740_14595 [Alphaproteobacteria bacterium]|nr:hypothetical protein [Alphaproteobacteria bacterium]
MAAPLDLGALDALKVTGSNGKGSVVRMLDALLRALGLHTGAFTSPHLRRLEERFARDGAPVDPDALRPALDWAFAQRARWEAAWPEDPVARFELLTLAALRLYTERPVDALILEAGIGGRLDPTRVPPGQVVGLSSVDLEHAALLGPSEALIALDKAELCPPGGVLVCGPLAPAVRRALEAHCALRGVEWVWAREACALSGIQMHPKGSRFDLSIEGQRVEGVALGLAGPHQLDNACVAILMAWRWLGRHHPGLQGRLLEVLPRALARLEHPGRATWVCQDPPTLLDAAHTPRATRALAALVSEACPPPRQLVLGASEGRDLEALLAPLWPLADQVHAYTPRHRGAPAEALIAQVGGRPAQAHARVEHALAAASAAARAQGGSVVMAGSLFGVAEALEWLEGGDPGALRFL